MPSNKNLTDTEQTPLLIHTVNEGMQESLLSDKSAKVARQIQFKK
jgi:hypothetical protein